MKSYLLIRIYWVPCMSLVYVCWAFSFFFYIVMTETQWTRIYTERKALSISSITPNRPFPFQLNIITYICMLGSSTTLICESMMMRPRKEKKNRKGILFAWDRVWVTFYVVVFLHIFAHHEMYFSRPYEFNKLYSVCLTFFSSNFYFFRFFWLCRFVFLLWMKLKYHFNFRQEMKNWIEMRDLKSIK